MSEPVVLILAIGLLLLGNGFFSGAEIAIISARRGRIEAMAAEGSRAARKVKELLDDLDSFLATVQIGVTLMGTLAGVFGGYLASRHLEPAILALGLPAWASPAAAATLVVGAGIVYVELILGELVPKAIALRHSETVALVVGWPLRWFSRLSRGLVRLLTASTRAVLALIGMRDAGSRTFVSEDEIRHMLKEGRQQGVLDQNEVELIQSVFEFSETPVRQVMVPRPKVFALDVATPPDEIPLQVIESGFSRIPVHDGAFDNVLGLVYAKDLLRVLAKGQSIVLRKVLHPAHFVPESKKVGSLLKELQKRRTHMALVIDEHGSVTGLVTLEDLIEEIVGEIRDEYDWEERPVERLRDGSLVVEGTVGADELRDAYAVPIPESDEFQTIAGFMLDRLGAVPRGGEVVTVGDFRLTVVDIERNRISKVKIEKAPVPVGG